jgi:23S rRNA (uracil1939-C5)-methyltransferase
MSAPLTFDVLLTTLTYGGDALGRLPDGRAVFVPFALPGERVRVELTEEKRGHARARLLEVLEPSPRRIEPLCVHFGICGGCQYQHMSYPDQLEAKTLILREQLQRLGGVENPPVQAILPDPRGWDYRNNVQFHLTPQGQVGYQEYYTNQTFAIQECHLLEDALDTIWPQLSIEPVPGLERVSLRLGDEQDILLALESTELTPPEFEVDLPISAVHLGPGGGPIILAGDDYQVMRVLDRPFKVSAGSFFQVNTVQAEQMVKIVLSLIPLTGQETIVDLYCGVGLFSTYLAPRAGKLVGVEYSPSACDDFAVNLDEFDNVELYQGEAGQVLPQLSLQPDVILVDPPRAGIERPALDAIIKMSPPLLVYVSCDPSTLARDVKRLLAAGYHLESTQPIDLFPQTFHIESISLLRR